LVSARSHPREQATKFRRRTRVAGFLALTAGQSAKAASIKGGLFFCALPNYLAHDIARRRGASRREVDLGAAHLGFRTVLNRSRQRDTLAGTVRLQAARLRLREPRL